MVNFHSKIKTMCAVVFALFKLQSDNITNFVRFNSTNNQKKIKFEHLYLDWNFKFYDYICVNFINVLHLIYKKNTR
jgi:hypothetical protein